MNETKYEDLRVDDAPNIKAMQAALDESVRGADIFVSRMVDDRNTRYAKWINQTNTGRKPETPKSGALVQPWPGSSDVRIRLADQFVNDDVKLCKAVSKRAKLRVKGRESADYPNAGKVMLYLQYLRETQLRREWRKQATLACQWRQMHGHSISMIDWLQETALEHVPITLEMLQKALQAPAEEQQQDPLALAATLLFTPERLGELAGTLVQWFPDLGDRGEAFKRINELKKTGKTTMPKRYVRVNRPRRTALMPFRDVFYPLNTSDIQRAPWVAVRSFMSANEVREKQVSEGWDEEFVDALLATEGKSVLDTLQQASDLQRREVFNDSIEETEGQIEVFYFYYTYNNEAGVPCRYSTVLSYHMNKDKKEGGWLSGPDEPLGFEHGLYPFIEHRREDNEDSLVENRGVPSIVMTHQQEIKNQRDGRINQMDMAMQPPVIRPEREVGLPLLFRPRGEIGERKSMSYRFGEVPNYQPGSEVLEGKTRADAEDYFARNATTPPARAQLYTQDLVDDWAEEESECWSMVLQLSQQYVDEVAFERVVGTTRTPMKVSRADIQGQYDISLQLDATPMVDPEAVENRLGQLQSIIALDRSSRINLDKVAPALFALLFPDLAEDGIDETETSSKREVDDEQNNWKSMLAGVPVPMVDKGQNFQVRKMTLEQILSNPENEKRATALPDTMQMVQERLKHLKFMVDQYGANAQAGRVGVLQGPAAA